MNHADRHDLDKLARWRDGFVAAEASGFPVYATFLVTGEDRESHDIFRRFRTDFEALGAEYSNLIIFGQHGTSTTMTALLVEFGLSAENAPLLALSTGPMPDAMMILELPKGNSDGPLDDSEPWGRVLARIDAAARGGAGLDLSGITELVPRPLHTGQLTDAAERVLAAMSS